MTHPIPLLHPHSSPLRGRVAGTMLFSLLLALPASAHPGHRLSAASPAHLLTSPDHLVAWLAAGLAFLLLAQFIRQQVPRRTLQVLGAATSAGAAFLLTIHP